MNTEPKKGFSFSSIILTLVAIVAIAYYGFGYVVTLPGKKAHEVKEKVVSKVTPTVNKIVTQQGKVFTIQEIGKNYIKIKGHFFTKLISPAELSEPLPEGTKELVKIGEKYTPLKK